MVWPTLGSRTAKEQEQEQAYVTTRRIDSLLYWVEQDYAL